MWSTCQGSREPWHRRCSPYCNEWDAFLNVVVGHCWTRNSAMLTGRILLLFLSTTNFMRTTDARSILSPFLARSNHVKPHVGLVFPPYLTCQLENPRSWWFLFYLWPVKMVKLNLHFLLCSIPTFTWLCHVIPPCLWAKSGISVGSSPRLVAETPIFWSKIGYDNLGICCIKKKKKHPWPVTFPPLSSSPLHVARPVAASVPPLMDE